MVTSHCRYCKAEYTHCQSYSPAYCSRVCSASALREAPQKRRKPVAETQQAILELLAEQPMTARELAPELDLHQTRVTRILQTMLHRVDGRRQIHICGWHRNMITRGRWAAIYAQGDAPDAREPDPKQAELESHRRYWHKLKGLHRAKAAYRRTGEVNPFLQLMQP